MEMAEMSKASSNTLVDTAATDLTAAVSKSRKE